MPAKSKKNSKEKNSIPAVVVIAGKDKFLVSSKLENVLDRLIDPDSRATALSEPDPDTAESADIFDDLRTLPFLSERRVVVLKEADKFITNHRQALEKYFDNPSSTGVLVMTVNSWNSRTKLARALPKIGHLFQLDDIKESQLPGYITGYIRDKHSKKISAQAVRLLIELAGTAPGVLCAEADKLATFAIDQKTIEEDHVEKLIGHNRGFDIFDVIDAATKGDTGAAVEKLRTMFATDRTAEYSSVGAIAYHLRRLFKARALMDSGMNINVISKQLRVWYNRDGFFRQVRALKLARIGELICSLATIDYSVKSGRMEPKLAIERLILTAFK